MSTGLGLGVNFSVDPQPVNYENTRSAINQMKMVGWEQYKLRTNG